MKSFAGFPAGKTRFTPIPDLFYTELLPAIQDLAELKLTLYMFWALNRQRGYPRYLTVAELEAEGPLLTALQRVADEGRDVPVAQGTRNELNAPTGDQLNVQAAVAVLREVMEKAVARGTLLRLSICDEAGQADYLFLNTPQGRKAVEQVRRGELVLEKTGYIRETHIQQEQPNILALYEQNIGLLQPMLAEELLEAELTYPPGWIVDAFRIAVEQNARNWRYIKRILERWSREGKDEGYEPAQKARRQSRR